jgi:hypothetical protein
MMNGDWKSSTLPSYYMINIYSKYNMLFIKYIIFKYLIYIY